MHQENVMKSALGTSLGNGAKRPYVHQLAIAAIVEPDEQRGWATRRGDVESDEVVVVRGKV